MDPVLELLLKISSQLDRKILWGCSLEERSSIIPVHVEQHHVLEKSLAGVVNTQGVVTGQAFKKSSRQGRLGC